MTVLQRFLSRSARSANRMAIRSARHTAAARRLTGTPPDRPGVVRTILRGACVGACVAAAMLVWAAPAHAQRYFGMNQVEYRHFRWRVIETEHFLIHYYPEEKVPAYDAARIAERSYYRLSRILGHQFREKKPILLFASRADFAENNVTGDLGEGTGGVTDASRQRIIVPFTGDYGSFEHVITHEMVHQFQYDIFSRGRAGANLQTLEQVNPPLWFMEGMAEYLSLGPNHVLTTTWVRSAIANGTFPSIKQMTDQPDKYFPYRYGEALWRYIGARWGDAAIGEILQNVTTNGIERGFQRELGVTLDQLSDQWLEATRAQYLPQLGGLQRAEDFAKPLFVGKKGAGDLYLAPVLSHNGKLIAFLARGSERRGEVFIDLWLGDAITGKRIRRLIKSTTNPSFEELRLLYSQGSFSPDDRYFAFTAQTGGRDVLSIVDVTNGDVKQLKNIPLDGVLSPVWSPDGRQLAFSGVTGGLTDLYVVDRDGNNLRALTKDRYGDLQPAWSPDGKTIAFSTDRGSTDLSDLKTGKLQIALLNVADGTAQVLDDQPGLNINPVWSPDGQSIAYISDRNGTPNLYLYDLATKTNSRLTNVQGGVGAITEYSPAITWSPTADRLAFTYYENGDYSIWTLNNPRAYKQTEQQTAQQPASQAEELAPMTVPAVPPRTTRDTMVVRGNAGYRLPSGRQPAARFDSLSSTSVATLMSDPHAGLPDTLMFKDTPYSVSFSPDYISGVGIGVGTGGGFGTQYGGTTTLVLSDLTGDHEMAAGVGINGRLQDASLLFGYANLSRRWQYSTGISQDVYYLYNGYFDNTDQTGTGAFGYQFVRYAFRQASISAEYPLNRFTRFEIGLQGNSIGRSVVNEQYTAEGGFITGESFNTVQSLSSLNFASPIAAFVSDNTLFGVTGPISGRRMRFSAAPALGNVHWVDYLVDYRRYDPIIFNTLTIASRFYGDFTVGRDEDLFPKYVGTPDFVRGYDQSSIFNGYSCDAVLGAPNVDGSQCAAAALVGTRVSVLNEELRFPIIRRFDLGALPIGLPPVDGLVFYDAGIAWDAGQKLSLTKPANYDYTIERYVMRSWGFGLRVNLFNLAVLRWDYAKPLDSPTNKKFNWTFSLGPNF